VVLAANRGRQLLIALRATAMESKYNALKTVGGRFFVPAPCSLG
jgi:hypothetical protein